MAESILNYFSGDPTKVTHRRPKNGLSADKLPASIELDSGCRMIFRAEGDMRIIENAIEVETPYGAVRDQRIGAGQRYGEPYATAHITQVTHEIEGPRHAVEASLTPDGIAVVSYMSVSPRGEGYDKLPFLTAYLNKAGEIAGLGCMTDNHRYTIVVDPDLGPYVMQYDTRTKARIDVFGPEEAVSVVQKDIGLHIGPKGFGAAIQRKDRTINVEINGAPEALGIAQLFRTLEHPTPWDIPAYNMPFGKLGISVYEQ